VFLPFAAGYYLSYLFRTINASISPALVSEFGIDASQAGLLASAYFLAFAGAQIPIGVLIDRYGPRRVQSVLLVIAVGGATLFGTAEGFVELLFARAMIGLGASAALMAGIKAVVIWFPKDRLAFVNGWMIMLGSLGAVTATAPTDWLLGWIGWRGVFEILTLAALAMAVTTYLTVPERDLQTDSHAASQKSLTLWSIYSDTSFLRIAPLSATCIGSSWALQSLWAASWLSDVEGFDRPNVMTRLLFMAFGLSLGAVLLGTIADRLRRRGVRTEVLLAAVAGLFVIAQLALVLRLPLPSILPWTVVAIMGAATVLSFAAIADYFPQSFAARANGALNLLHFGWAFIVQCGIGFILAKWLPLDGHYPTAAYQAAFGLSILLQVSALLWFLFPWLRGLAGRADASYAGSSTERGSQAGSVMAPVGGYLLEDRDVIEW